MFLNFINQKNPAPKVREFFDDFLFFRSDLQVVRYSEYDDPEEVYHGNNYEARNGLCRMEVNIDRKCNNQSYDNGDDIQHDRIDEHGGRFP